MTARLISLAPARVAELVQAGEAVLVDVREPDEFSRRHVEGALSRPLSAFGRAALKTPPARQVVFTCRSGMRTAANCDRLAAAVDGEAYVLEGGVDGWAAAGLPVVHDRKAPIEIIRQVQIAAGLLILAGVVLGFTVGEGFFLLSGAVGAGLTFAGLTGTCAMARLLGLAPWNRRPGA